MSDEAFVDWFQIRRYTKVLEMIQKHVQKVVDTGEAFEMAVKCLITNDDDTAIAALKRMTREEKAADKISEDFLQNLSKRSGAIPGKVREDLFRLVGRTDRVADWIKVAGRNLEIIVDVGINIPEQILKRYVTMATRTLEASLALQQCIKALGVNEEMVIDSQQKVHKLEQRIDVHYFKIKKLIVSPKVAFDPRVIILLNDMLVGLENSSDNCKEAADLVVSLLIANR